MPPPKALIMPGRLSKEGKTSWVIHFEPAFVADCDSCSLRQACETKSKSQRPVIRSESEMDIEGWRTYLETSNCHPSLNERDW